MASETRQRQWQKEKARQGLCIICGKVAERGVYCLHHYEMRRERIAKKREESGQAVGKRKTCTVCGGEGHNKRSCPMAVEGADNDTQKASA